MSLLILHKVTSYCVKTPIVFKENVRQIFMKNVISVKLSDTSSNTQSNLLLSFVRCYSDKPFISKVKDTSAESKKQTEKDKKKKGIIPRITLLDENNKISVTTLEEANKIAKRRDLKLVFVRDDTKAGREEYKLLSKTAFLKSDLEDTDPQAISSSTISKSKTSKKEKSVMLSSRIAENDLKSKIKQMNKWLEKKIEIKVCVTNESGGVSGLEEIYDQVEKELGSQGRLVQKRMKDTTMKFQILPPKIVKKE